MSKSLDYGPNGTAVEGVTSITFPVSVLNYDADFRLVEESAGQVVYTDVTSPTDQPSTMRLAQKARPNVYAGTSIDPSVFLPNKQGTDTVIEIREVWMESDSTDASYLRQFPVRCAITFTVPAYAAVTKTQVKDLVSRALAGLFGQAETTVGAGLEAILRGSLLK